MTLPVLGRSCELHTLQLPEEHVTCGNKDKHFLGTLFSSFLRPLIQNATSCRNVQLAHLPRHQVWQDLMNQGPAFPDDLTLHHLVILTQRYPLGLNFNFHPDDLSSIAEVFPPGGPIIRKLATWARSHPGADIDSFGRQATTS